MKNNTIIKDLIWILLILIVIGIASKSEQRHQQLETIIVKAQSQELTASDIYIIKGSKLKEDFKTSLIGN